MLKSLFVSLAKMLTAAMTVAGPFLAGFLVPQLMGEPGAALLVTLLGLGVGGFGLMVFCALDSAEEVDHLRRLNPGMRV